MALQTLTNEGYYRGSQTFAGIGNTNSVSIDTNGGVGSVGSPSIDVTLDNVTGLVVGMLVTGSGLTASVAYKIAEITNGTDIKLDVAAVIGDNVSLTFIPITNATFDLTTTNFDPLPTEEGEFNVYIDNVLQNSSTYSYSSPVLTFITVPASGSTVSIELLAYDREYGSYQNIKLKDIVNNFIMGYVGNGKLLKNVNKSDILFHAQRGIQELSYDTLQSTKSQEIEVSPALSMPLPHDYVNYVKVSWTNDAGNEYILYPIRKSSNPNAILQDGDYNYIFDADGKLTTAENSETWKKFKDNTTTDATSTKTTDWYTVDRINEGVRYGLTPEFAQNNGCFLIDQIRGLIHVTSNISGRIIVLQYISDGLHADENTLVHKFAEEALYKHIAHAILSTKTNIPEYIINRHRKERRAAIRNAKLRLSNLKSEELTQIMRGKAKHIK
jgi:hypothetical protein